MKLVSWNIDGLNAALTGVSNRAILSKQTLKEIAAQEPYVIALQETKLSELTERHKEVLDEIFPEYNIEHSMSDARKGYAGTMFIYKGSPIVSKPNILTAYDETCEGRLITLEYDGFYIVNVYTPNASRDLVRLPYRLKWDAEYTKYIRKLQESKPVILCGDFNVARTEIDLKNPKGNVGKPGFTNEERASFEVLMESGLVDAARSIHGDVEGLFTWWTQMSKTAKFNNSGWRLDYFLVSGILEDSLVNSEVMDTGIRADHAPISIELNMKCK